MQILLVINYASSNLSVLLVELIVRRNAAGDVVIGIMATLYEALLH